MKMRKILEKRAAKLKAKLARAIRYSTGYI